jgi:uncharacterized protein (DUF885 family)
MKRRDLLKLQAMAGLGLALGLNRGSWAAAGNATTKRFYQQTESFLQKYLKLNPETATALGDHRYDGEWCDCSPKGIAALADFYETSLNDLWKLDSSQLSEADRVDADILQNNCKLAIFVIRELKEFSWNPLIYNPGGALNVLLARDFAPLGSRLKSLQSRLAGLPKVLEGAKQNLKNPPKLYTQTAIQQNQGVISFIKDEVIKAHPGNAGLQAAAQVALKSLENYGEWLQKTLLPRSDRSFRIGPSLFAKKLQLTLETDLPADQILIRAKAELKKTLSEMALVARSYANNENDDRLSEKEICRKVLDVIAETKPTNANILDRAEDALARATQFVKDKQVVSLPSEPCKIIEMPEFNRGVAIAYCDSPGPLEKKGETFYAISPTPQDWTPQRVESFYREYNLAMLENLTVHEAMPGHFLQAMHGNRFKATNPIRAIFGSGTFVEGWATYTEQVMAGLGFGGTAVKMQQLKMRLRLILNAILDHGVHAGNLTEEKAVKMLMEEGFQEEGEAVGKWKRACLSSAQLSTYYVGNLDVNQLASDYKRAYPSASMREMHDDMLKFGSPACRYIRRLLKIKVD